MRPFSCFLLAAVALLIAVLFLTPPADACLNTGENAVNVLGQDAGTFSGNPDYTETGYDSGSPNLETGANDTPNAFGFQFYNSNYGADTGKVALDSTNHRLFVVDPLNSRVLVWNLNSSNQFSPSSMIASNVLGQPDFRTGNNFNTSQSLMYFPEALAFDAVNNRLFVVDTDNSRVLVYKTSTITNGMSASYELGHASNCFICGSANNGGSVGQATLSFPQSVAFDASNELLYVGDTGNSRVLIFNVAPASIANGENASYVLGQSNFTSNSADQGGSAGQPTLDDPPGVAVDTTNDLVYVADLKNNRVMVFPSTANSNWGGNGENASYVLGQSNFTNRSANQGGASPGQATLSSPHDVSLDVTDNLVYVADEGNNRVVIFPTPSNGSWGGNGENAY
jgi:DNA-binding beta-propeller fold protein YncE